MVLALITSRGFMLQVFSGQIKRRKSHQTLVQGNYHESLQTGRPSARNADALPRSRGDGPRRLFRRRCGPPWSSWGSLEPLPREIRNLPKCLGAVTGAMGCGEGQGRKTIAGDKPVVLISRQGCRAGPGENTHFSSPALLPGLVLGCLYP